MKHIPLNSTPEQRENLKKLAHYLSSGQLKAEFDMFSYSKHNTERTDCGTIGCAAGHGPYAGVYKQIGESWQDYVERSFVGLDDNFGYGLAYEWLFSFCWTYTDNTPRGAAKRIYYALEYGILISHNYNPAIYDNL